MSHFTVIVIGKDPEKQLAPYHEFECTGRDDEYVVEVDITEEMRGYYEKREKKEETFTEFVAGDYDLVPHGEKRQGKYGYGLLDEAGEVVKVIRRTNPNAKWDWYRLGGRWTGFFKLKNGMVGVTGSPGILTEEAPEGRTDQAFLKDIDLEGMRNDAGNKASMEFDMMLPAFEGKVIPSWAEFLAKYEDRDKAREAYKADPVIRDMFTLDKDIYWKDDLREYYCEGNKEKFVQRARDGAIVSFAFVRDGKWFERGKMGWWATVSNEKDRDEWNRQFNAMIDDLPPDTLLSLCDCHI